MRNIDEKNFNLEAAMHHTVIPTGYTVKVILADNELVYINGRDMSSAFDKVLIRSWQNMMVKWIVPDVRSAQLKFYIKEWDK